MSCLIGIKKDRKAFTLIELLVVVAIIALLISILLPSLAKAREQAKRIACAANLKGISTATLTYAEDSKGFLPAYDPAVFNGGTLPASLQVARVGFERIWSLSELLKQNKGDPQSNTRAYYQLVANDMTTAKMYICPSAQGTVGHSFDNTDGVLPNMTPLFDFSAESRGTTTEEMIRFSYSFLSNLRDSDGTTTRGILTKNTHDPRRAIMADRNPFMNSFSPSAGVGSLTAAVATYAYSTSVAGAPRNACVQAYVDGPAPAGYSDWLNALKSGNSRNHRKAGQNVAYLDGHCVWGHHPRVGADDDHIWVPVSRVTGGTYPPDLLPESISGTAFGQAKIPAGAHTDSFLVP
ncbi:MAG: prepilin-type N-terminal cleavage/methylation domain-containing protein [Phycisphaerae bacterium]|nr:prepilin-type N-terminal cleavage/methylation domain-containing protein [Phycisphaerae bacterium]